jgi:hypothetical protein
MCFKKEKGIVLTHGGSIRHVDECMRSIVQFLNDNRINTLDSCCGHGERWGHITINIADVERAQTLGFRLCTDLGETAPPYPFAGNVEGQINLVFPPILLDQRSA